MTAIGSGSMAEPTFFEGPEKKVELVVSPRSTSLRSLPESFWDSVVVASRARILSKICNHACDAYLLSESSLFVYDDHLTMITCGQTRLVDGVRRMLEVIPQDAVSLVIYERKNEFFPERQATTFREDARALQQLVPGQAFRLGGDDAQHLCLFASERPYAPDPMDTTLEILMHNLDERVVRRFRNLEKPARGSIAEQLGITQILPGFDLDEYAFRPAGYSMNALAGNNYYTVHVTPERLGCYVSFETNVDFRRDNEQLVRRVLEVFAPRSFIVMAFSPTPWSALEVPGWHLLDRVDHRQAGYSISFTSWYRPGRDAHPAVAIDL